MDSWSLALIENASHRHPLHPRVSSEAFPIKASDNSAPIGLLSVEIW